MTKENMIKKFIYDYKTKYNNSILSLNAGYIKEDGIIVLSQIGIEKTFSVGMPIYNINNEKIGNLSIGLYEHLDNYIETKEKKKYSIQDIPVEYWKVENYKGINQKIKTYHQVFSNLVEEIKE